MGVIVTLIRRCAWCQKVYGPDGWAPSRGDRGAESETATICPHCVAQLETLREDRPD